MQHFTKRCQQQLQGSVWQGPAECEQLAWRGLRVWHLFTPCALWLALHPSKKLNVRIFQYNWMGSHTGKGLVMNFSVKLHTFFYYFHLFLSHLFCLHIIHCSVSLPSLPPLLCAFSFPDETSFFHWLPFVGSLHITHNFSPSPPPLIPTSWAGVIEGMESERANQSLERETLQIIIFLTLLMEKQNICEVSW